MATWSVFRKIGIKLRSNIFSNNFLRPHYLYSSRQIVTKSNSQRFSTTVPSSLFLSAGIFKSLSYNEKKEEKEDKLIRAIKFGIYNVQEKNYAKASTSLHLALKIAQDRGDEDGITYVYDQLANLSFITKDYEQSERLFIEVIKRLMGPNKNIPKDHNAILEISLKLANIFHLKGEYDKSEMGFLYCLETIDEKLKKDTESLSESEEDTLSLLGMANEKYGDFLVARGRYDEGIIRYKSAHNICIQIHQNETHPQSLVILNSVGNAYNLKGDHHMAMEFFENVVKFAEETNDEQLPVYYLNLGLTQLNAHLEMEAKINCSKAKSLAAGQGNDEVIQLSNDCYHKAKFR